MIAMMSKSSLSDEAVSSHDPFGADGHAAYQRFKPKLAIGLGAMLVVLALYAWAVDFITLEGEYTVYTADCMGGTWVGKRCSGSMRAGDRFKFHAVKAHRQVQFWKANAAEPAGVLSDCEILSDRNWSCPASDNANAARTITLQMAQGRPTVDPRRRTRPFHSVPKLHWLLMQAGLGWGDEAND